ncbi:BatD family protein [uncultured Tenacibaculum sp.]|uniref:BatD family protein n=1 Tax=uncultured Tenacibaculum sp. TaxID=174713 RepID=UPI00262D1170|nr:BatD family protein [uncultured Tenacibaculum sp.]
MRKNIFYIFLLICSVGFSQSNKIHVEVDTTNIKIGEQFQYKISVDETENVIIPKLNNLKGLEVIDTLKIDTIKNKLVQKYILTGFDSGAFYIPQQQIFIKNQAYLTDSLLINVATIAIDTTKIKKFPIKGIKGEPYQLDDFKGYIYWAIALLILIGLLVYYFIFKKKKEEKEAIVVPSLPPYEEAIQRLQELDNKLLWQNNHIKKYYSELTGIVRAYIERELKIPALESTTDELIDTLKDFDDIKSIETTKETIQKLKELLQESDLVKFAKSKPLSNEIEQDRKDAKNVIDNLKPKKEEIEDEVE